MKYGTLLNVAPPSHTLFLFGLVVAGALLGTTQTYASRQVLVINPYQNIDWTAVQHHKGNLHTHTTESDGSLTPEAAIAAYHETGYGVLALTDHDRCTWPWEDYSHSPQALGMVAIAGNELSRHHHVLSLFSEYETDTEDLDEAIAGVADAGGIAILCHPAMHWEPQYSDTSRLRRFLDDNARPPQAPSEAVAQYIDLFKRHPHLIATEISNASEPLYRYPLDRRLWDQLLTVLMPERPVWGVNTDDMHTMDHFNKDWVVFLTERLEVQAVRESLEQGAYYFSTCRVPESAGGGDAVPPRIVAIVHNTERHVLEVEAAAGDAAVPEDAYVWISGGTVIATGPHLSYRNTPGLAGYARLEITTPGGVTFTNPFGFRPE